MIKFQPAVHWAQSQIANSRVKHSLGNMAAFGHQATSTLICIGVRAKKKQNRKIIQ